MKVSDYIAFAVLVLLAINVIVAFIWFVVMHHRGHFKRQAVDLTADTLSNVAPTPEPVQAAPAPIQGAATQPVGQLIDSTEMQASAKLAFQQAISESTAAFKTDISDSSKRLSELIVRLTSNVVEQELEVYRKELSGARDLALNELRQMQTVIADKQKELEQGIDSELGHRKQLLIDRLDAKLGAAAAAYIVESLGQSVDLGAQRSYMMSNLEQHKDQLKQDLSDDL